METDADGELLDESPFNPGEIVETDVEVNRLALDDDATDGLRETVL